MKLERDPDRVFVFFGKVFFVSLMPLLVFLVCEGILVWRGSVAQLTHLSTPIDERYPRPYVEFSGQPNHYPFNALGYVGDLPSPQKDRELRIFVTGGSTVRYGAPTIPVALQEIFRAKGYRNVKVFNFGITSTVSGQEVARLVYDISQFEPDLVIQYNGGNDIIHGYNWDPRPGYPFNYLLYENNPLLHLNGTGPGDPFTLFLASSRFVRRFFPQILEARLVNLKGTYDATIARYGSEEERYKAALAEYVRHVRLSNKIAHALRSEFTVFFQPLRAYDYIPENPVPEHLSENSTYIDVTLFARDLLLKQFSKVPAAEQLDFVDLSLSLRNQANPVWKDEIHVHDAYNAKIAGFIFDRITGPAGPKAFRQKLRAH